jgi:hypothetical protein
VGRHLVARQHPLHQQLDLATGGLFAEQARLEHPGVVEHQQVARRQQRREVPKDAVDRQGLCAVEQARGAALCGGLLGDQFGGQGEVEITEGEDAAAGGRGRVHGA